MIGYCPSAGRIQPRHLLSFSTDSTAIAQVNRSFPARGTRTLRLSCALSLSLSVCISLSLSLSLSRLSTPFFLPPLSSRPRATSVSSRAVRFGIDAAADTGEKKKENRTARPGNCVHAGARATGARSDRFIAATADASHARAFLFLAFRQPARFRPLSPDVIRDLRRDGRAPRGFDRETDRRIETHPRN